MIQIQAQQTKEVANRTWEFVVIDAFGRMFVFIYKKLKRKNMDEQKKLFINDLL
jgi:hypothetical protein